MHGVYVYAYTVPSYNLTIRKKNKNAKGLH